MRNISVAHVLVALACIASLTFLGAYGVLSEVSLVSMLGPIIGAIFGAAISNASANGQARDVLQAALERAAAVEAEVARRQRADRKAGRG